MDVSGWACSNPKCQHLSEYNNQIIGKNWSIKKNTIAASIMLGGRFEYYCGGCIDEIYHLIKSKLDRNLWSFQ